MSTVLIVGATGYTGLIFTRAFANAIAASDSPITRVYALVQPSSLANPAKAASVQAIRDIPNVEIRAATFDDPESLAEALKDVDIVVSALAGEHGIPAQLPLIEAAKNAGVKRFVPSDYATDCRATHVGPTGDLKLKVHKALFDSGLNYTIVDPGCFFKYWVGSLGVPSMIDRPVEPVLIYGEGMQLANFVDVPDIASYIVRAVTDPRLEKRRLWIDNGPLAQLELVKTWEKITGREIQKKFVSREEADKEFEKAEGYHMFLWRIAILTWFEGVSMKTSDYLLSSELYPELVATTKSVEQFLTEVAKQT